MVIIRRLTNLVLLTVAAGLLVGCVPVPPYDPALAQQGAYAQPQTEVLPPPTAAAATRAEIEPTGTPVPLAQIEPTGTPVAVAISPTNSLDAQAMAARAATETPAPTLTSTTRPTVTPAPSFTSRPTSTVAAIPTRAPTPTATVDQHLLIITEEDIAVAVAAGAGAQQGVTVDNLRVRFADGKTHITADRLGYGIIKMQNLDLVGRLVAQNGVLSLAVESISPRGLAASFLPGAVNQTLANFGSQWYVEEVRTLDGRMELQVR